MTRLFDHIVKRGLLTAALLFPIVCIMPSQAEVMQRKLPTPAPTPTQVMPQLPQASSPAVMKQLPQANTPAVMQPANAILPPLAPLNLAIEKVNTTTSKLTWNYPDGNLQRKLTGIEWSLCTGPGDNCPHKTIAPPQININDKSLGTFLGFSFEKVKNGTVIVGVKMCYINALGSGCARIDVPKPAPVATIQGVLPLAKAPTPSDLNASRVTTTYLQIGTIAGESVAAGHVGWIKVDSFNWHIPSVYPGSSSSTVATGGPGSVTLSKRSDKASAALQNAAATGVLFPSVTLDEVGYLKCELKNVMVSSYKAGGSGGGDQTPTEQFTLNFSAIEFHYLEQPVQKWTPKSRF